MGTLIGLWLGQSVTVFRKHLEIDQSNVSPADFEADFRIDCSFAAADYILSLFRYYDASSVAPI